VRQFREGKRQSANPPTDTILNYLDTAGAVPSDLQDAKDPNGLDWYVEGPGKRVGYDDLTAIDWVFEYSKERQRLRILNANTTGLIGHLRHFADSGQIWVILVFTGIAVGTIAACIDLVSDWLGDLKTGYCSNVAGGGRFYLNKYFCCWGLDSKSISRLQTRQGSDRDRFRQMHGLAIMEHSNGRTGQGWQLDY